MTPDTYRQSPEGLISRSGGPGPELICLVALLLYILTALPALGLRDNPEFADTAYTLGVAHPAGFPTYSLTAKVMTFLPVGSIPFRVTLFATFVGAAALYLLYRLISRASTGGSESRRWAAAFVTTVFALSTAMWTNTTETEVYTFNLFFLSIILYCALRWSDEENDAWLYTGSFIYGLSAGNHATVAFFLPGLLIYVIGHWRSGIVKRLALVFFFFLLGFGVYAYLPIRAATDPAFNFGNPETFERFVNLITNKKGSHDNFSGMRHGLRFFDYAWIFLSETVPKAFWPAGLPLMVIGFWRLIRNNWPLAAALILVCLANVLFFLRWTNPTAFLPTFFSCALVCGVGLSWLMEHWRLFAPDRILASGRTLWIILLIIAGGGAWLQYPARNQSRDYLPWETFRTDYESLPPDAITISGVLWFHHQAFKDIYRLRDDVITIGLADFLRPEWFNPVTKERFPRVAVPPPPYTGSAQGEYLKRFLRANLSQKRDIYIEPFDLDSGTFYPNMKPAYQLLFKFTDHPLEELSTDMVQKFLDRIRNKVKREIETDRFLDCPEIRAYWITFGFQIASYFQRHHRSGDAFAMYLFLDDLFGPKGMNNMLPGDQARINVNLGVYLMKREKLSQALERFQTAVDLDPYDFKAWSNLGLAYLKSDQLENARSALEKALELNPNQAQALYNMGQYCQKIDQYDQARTYYERALKFFKTAEQKQHVKDQLKTLEKEATLQGENAK